VEDYDIDRRLTLMFCFGSDTQYLKCRHWVGLFESYVNGLFEYILYCTTKSKSFSVIGQINFD